MFGAVRRYRGLHGPRREELAAAIADELVPRLDDSVGLHVFAVVDQGDVLTTTTSFADEEAAREATRRPSTSTELTPEVEVAELRPGRPRPVPERPGPG